MVEVKAYRQRYGRGYRVYIPSEISKELDLQSERVEFLIRIDNLNGKKVIILEPLSK